MCVIKTVNEVWDMMFNDFKEEVEGNPKKYYNAVVLSQPPIEPLMPQVQLSMYQRPYSENLSKGEVEVVITVEVDIYAQDVGKVARKEITGKLQEEVFEYFYTKYGFQMVFDSNLPLVKEGIDRIKMRYRGYYSIDTGIIRR